MTFDPIAEPLLLLLLGYLLGSIPFGFLLARIGGAGDIREIGSGNIGATNVLRTGRKGLAALTLVLDGLKGAAAVLIAARLAPGQEALSAMGAVLGHLYPVWLRFRGGKGVATLFGVVAALQWQIGLVYAGVWLGVLALTRYSSLAGMMAAFVAPVAAALIGRFDLALLFLGFAILVFWKHRSNIQRLFSGTESKVGSSRDE